MKTSIILYFGFGGIFSGGLAAYYFNVTRIQKEGRINYKCDISYT